MKIAFAFLLVGLCTFFASSDANVLNQCPGRLTKSSKEITCDQNCLIESAFMIIKIVAGLKKCSEEIIINEVLDCLEIDISLKVREAFFKNDATTLMNTSVDVDKIYAALCCMMKKLYDADGLSLLMSLNGALSSMIPLLGDLVSEVVGVLWHSRSNNQGVAPKATTVGFASISQLVQGLIDNLLNINGLDDDLVNTFNNAG